ncbi:ABC transporter integral membrane subunit [Candidatus Halobonum tyrrellensis G22]|uniref:ABC transporter integral membrane subunit n=1 Tax=Candidatus Halobonum tyrrellensis G22 TaxID=1324957 RepID=V4HN85_9EURY|nr:ABC transporter permease [Candidatus Halobonum tyrrellensis]ESP89364.1 ABC transporter integral membrane subunit [Candidatus Halobonum tyrrellensis G22]
MITITFALIRALPGGPGDAIRAQVMQSGGSSNVDMTQLNALVESYTNVDPSTPLYVQYWDYVTSILQGDLGQSIWYGRPVSEIIVQALPWTVLLLTIAILLTFAIGIVLGAAMAYAEGTDFDVGSTVVSMLLNSVPYYIAAILLVYFLSIQFGVFPQSGNVSSGLEPSLSLSYVGDVLYHAVLPVASLVITGFGGTAITMRGNAIQEIGEDYIRVAHLRGVPGRRIAVRYVGRNAILPMYTQFMISVGFMFGGSVILEQIFAYPGLGYYLLEAISTRDYPLMMGGFLVIAVAVMICVLIADLTYSRIDPRISDDDAREAY